MKLFSFLTITHMAMAQNASQIQAEVEKWSPSGKTCEGKSGFAPGKCENERGFCCNVADTDSCDDKQRSELAKRYDNYALYRPDQDNKFGGWQCMVPKKKKTAKQHAQIEKCLKSFDPTIYKSDHGKIGNFHKTLAKIMAGGVDRPGWQCEFLKKLRNGFYDYLKLRKECAGKASSKQKKANQKAKKQAARDKVKEDLAKKQAENKEKRLQREEAKAQKEQEETRKRREDEQNEDEVANVDEFVFNDDGSNEVADSSALKELNQIVDQLQGMEDYGDYTLDDLQAIYDKECSGNKVDDQEMCDDISNLLSGEDRSTENVNAVTDLRKAGLARNGIKVWAKTYIPNIGSCRKRRQALNEKTVLVVEKLLDMRIKYKTNPQKLKNKRNQKKAKEQAKAQREKEAAQREKEKEQKEKERSAKLDEREKQKAEKQAKKEQQ